MSELTREPDRINTTKKVKDFISEIDNKKFFGLNTPDTSRMELFLFAFSIGLGIIPSPLENHEALVLDANIKTNEKALMYSAFIGALQDLENIDAISQKGDVYKSAEEYANSGFRTIENLLHNKSEETILNDLLIELDDKYKSLFNNAV